MAIFKIFEIYKYISVFLKEKKDLCEIYREPFTWISKPKPGPCMSTFHVLFPRLMVFSNFSGSEFSDADLADVGNDNAYKPDKGKGDKLKLGGHSGSDLDHADDNHDTMAETGTIAGIVSAVAMALAGAVSGYISYQKKKLCFSIQQSLNADMVKADAPDAVVAQEPQVQQTLLQPPNAEPPTEENAV
uniref:CD99 antigen-like protein 2 n=1 Tax=Sinocyclocheilus grahami TaxID=75366 RepID=A0A672Q4T0_SINGR